MSTQTLVPVVTVDTAFSSSVGTHPAARMFKQNKDGRSVLTLEGVPIFRSGTFRDSWGDQATWEDLHITQMVTNFDHLRASGVFADVPVRKGHGGFLSDPMDSLIGYVTSLSTKKATSPVDGQTYSYLLADYDILDPDAQANISSGLWRNRSAEVGHFVSNAEAEYWPTLVGFAYVDIPAVEGLNFSASSGKLHEFGVYIAKNHKGDDGMATKDTNPAPPAAPQPPAPPAAPAEPPAEPTAEGTGPEVEATEGDAQTNTSGGVVGPLTEADRVDVVPDNETAIPVTEPQSGPVFAKHGETFEFTISGIKTKDFSAVQKHITTLETALAERDTAARNEFCDTLATRGVVLASNLDATKAFATSLSSEQFAAWKATQDAAPALKLFGQYEVVTDQQSGDAAEFEIAVGIVEQHKRSNLKPDAIRETASYKKMVTLGDKLGLSYTKV